MAATLHLNCKPYKFQLPKSKSSSTRGRKFAGIRCLASASSFKSYTITLLPGDGIGPEVVSIAKNALLRVSSVEGFELKFKEMPMGGAALDLTGVPLPEETLSAAKESDAVLLGAIGGYKWDNNEKHLKPETGLLQLREGLKVFANLRPATVLPQLVDASTLKKEIAEGVDLMVVRELTGGIYFGKPRGLSTNENGEECAFNTEVYAAHEIDRIAWVAFETARKRRGKLCSVDKANVLESSMLWRRRVEKIASEYPDVELSHMYVDNAAMQLVRNPKQFDTIVTNNIFGDILSDEASMITGSIGMLPSASLGESGPGLFEPIHGSAPDIAGQDKANPLATVLSAAMLLKYGLGQEKAAKRLDSAVLNTLNRGFRTSDIYSAGLVRGKMLISKNKPPCALVLMTLISVLLLFISSADAEGNGAVSGGVGRSLLEGNNAENLNSTSLVLAKERTLRKDPLNARKYYTGGWNISDEHYIASVLYTGSPLFLVAAIWFVGFGLFLLLVSMYVCCCRRHRYGYSRFAYSISLILLSLFTVSAIVGSVVLYTGQGKFHDSTSSTLDYVVGQANSTVNNLKDVSNYLTSAKKVGVDQVFLPQNVQNNIDKVNNLITSSATKLEEATNNNKDDIFHYLDAVGLILIVVASVMLALALLGFVLSISGLQFLVYILVFVGWMLVAVTFILCGVFLVLHNMMGDTCVAMNDWVMNPTAHTALDKVIPCVDVDTAQETLSQSKDVTFEVVGLVNGIITNVTNAQNLPPPSVAPLISYNQSGPFVPLLCNPYNIDKTNRRCAAAEADLSNATQIWRNYVCQVSNNNICTTVGRLTPTLYHQMSSAVNVSYGLYHYGPFLTNLVDCTFVRDTFRTIHDDHCPDLERYSRFVYIGLAMVSAAVMLSLILWVLYARERRHRKYTKLVDATGQNSLESKGPQ